jgi:citrate synthase
VTQIDAWRTEISFVEPGRIVIRGRDLSELILSSTFGEVVFLLITGQTPSKSVGRLIESLLVALSDHGVHAPSTIAARVAASSGTPLQASVAAGIAAVGDHHGGAVEGAMYALREILDLGGTDAVVADYVARLGSDGRRFPGFGHPYHRPDPRADALLEVAAQEGLVGPACELLAGIATCLGAGASGEIMVNVDGVAAALLIDAGVSPAAGRGFFIIARAAGLVAHAVEEATAERPVRMIDPATVVYLGPEPTPGQSSGQPDADAELSSS